MSYQYDLIVIGAGSAGVRAARFSAGFGAKVAVIEEHRPGGTCVIRGCVPKKLMVYASEFHEEFKAARGFGWSGQDFDFDWKKFKDRRDKEISRLSDIYLGLLKQNNVDFFSGSAKVSGANSVNVEGKEITASKILVAVGGWPDIPEIKGRELAWSSNEIFESDTRPESVLIVGAGFIAVEFAGILNGLGVETELLVRSKFLRGFDEDCSAFLKAEYEKKNIKITLGAVVDKIEKVGESFCAYLDNGHKRTVSRVIFATGRNPKTKDLGLESIGVKMANNGAICVDSSFATNIPSIYALGDCIDRINLTPVALMQASLWARENFDAANGSTSKMSYENIPSAVFSSPTLSTVGLTEQACMERQIAVEIFESNFKSLKHTLSGLEERNYMKMVVRKSDQRVIGLHMVGKDAAEIIQLGAVALRAGATKSDFDNTIGIHPSSAEEFVTMRTPRKI